MPILQSKNKVSMTGLLNFLFAYLLLIIFWFVVNLIFYALTIITRKTLFYIPFALNLIISWIIPLYIIFSYLRFLWLLIVGKEWILLVLMLIVGGVWMGFWQEVLDFLMFPINGITIFFSQKSAENLEKKGEEYDYEIISPDGKILGKFQSVDKENKLLAKWFVISYAILFFHPFTKPGSYEGIGIAWPFISTLVVQVVVALIVGVFLGIWNFIRTKSLFRDSKKTFITKCLKVVAIIYGFFAITNLLFY